MTSSGDQGSPAVTTGQEGDRVTTLELLFDLVYAFAFTQVTALMSEGGTPRSVLDGLVVLSLLWWSWVSYTWLANEARADRGIVRVAFIAATMAMFTASLVIPRVFSDEPSGLNAAGMLVLCYALVRFAHVSAYLVAARHDPALRRQLLLTLATSVLPTLALMSMGTIVAGNAQLWIWLAAVLYVFAAIFVTAVSGGGWAIRSAAHFAERHGLVVILALGESIVAIGQSVAHAGLDLPVVIGSLLAVGLAIGLWFAYFHRLLDQLEEGLAERGGQRRAKYAREVFTYLHFPIIAGIILVALGIEQAISRLHEGRATALGTWALNGGTALFLAATAATALPTSREWLTTRLTAAGTLLALTPILTGAPALIVLLAALAVVLAVEVVESIQPSRRNTGRPAVEHDHQQRAGTVSPVKPAPHHPGPRPARHSPPT